MDISVAPETAAGRVDGEEQVIDLRPHAGMGRAGSKGDTQRQNDGSSARLSRDGGRFSRRLRRSYRAAWKSILFLSVLFKTIVTARWSHWPDARHLPAGNRPSGQPAGVGAVWNRTGAAATPE
jgi:hypothetical protein